MKGNIYMDDKTRQLLMDYDYPGNVRELRNIIERLLVLSEHGEIKEEYLPSEILSGKKMDTADKLFETDYTDTLKEYRYSIIIENDESDYFFSEKITNCFAAQTIPIYVGAKKIGQFFNKDGIIQISSGQLSDLDEILKCCTPRNYEERIPAILDNYERVHQYKNVYDWLYEKYFIE